MRALALIDDKASQARKDLAAKVARFSSTADTFLAAARSALSGDLQAMTADTLAASVVYQNAYRVFDLVDLGLLPIETMLDRADQRVYGAVSLTMAFSAGRIQDAVDLGMTNIVGGENTPTTDAIWVPLGIAACERIGDPKVVRKSPTLEPFVEHGLVTAVGRARNHIIDKIDKKVGSDQAVAADSKAPSGEAPRSSRPALLLASADGIPTALASAPSAALQSPAQSKSYATGMLQTYIASEWAMRKAMTAVSPDAQQSLGPTGVSRLMLVSASPDEALVKRSALSLSAARVVSLGQASSVGTSYSAGLSTSAARFLSVTKAAAAGAATASVSTTQNLYVDPHVDLRTPSAGNSTGAEPSSDRKETRHNREPRHSVNATKNLCGVRGGA